MYKEIPNQPLNKEKVPKNRLSELIQKDLIGKALQSQKEGSKRSEMLKWKNGILRTLLLGTLSEQYYGAGFDFGSVTEEGGGPAMQDPDFVAFLNSVSKDSLIMMLETKKQEMEEALAKETPNTEDYISTVYYIDACDDLITDLER